MRLCRFKVWNAALPPGCAERLCLSVKQPFSYLRGYASHPARRSLAGNFKEARRKAVGFPHSKAAEPHFIP
jgi:hypothetical protein